MTHIVIADIFPASNGDIDLSPITQLGQTVVYKASSPSEFIQRASNASIVVVNKIKITSEVLDQLPALKCICLLATGYDNVDTAACRERNIVVCNARDYSSHSVAQHVFSLLLHMYNQVGDHVQSVKAGEWNSNWCYYLKPIDHLFGKTIGILGYGKIGHKVATIAQAFGMKVLAHKRHPTNEEGIEFVDIDHLFSRSDIVSLHAPLTPETNGIVDKVLLNRMKPEAILINTGRGGLINEHDLRSALLNRRIRAAALDVLSQEPPPPDHPLLGLDNCILTPHVAWANIEARRRLIQCVAENIRAFIGGNPTNIVPGG